MTEAEELELLELEEQEAKAKKAPAPDPGAHVTELPEKEPPKANFLGMKVNPDYARAMTMQGLDGLTLGHADELVGAEQAAIQTAKRGLRHVGLMAEDPREDPRTHVSDAIDRPEVRINGKVSSPAQHVPDADYSQVQDEGLGDTYRRVRDEVRADKADSEGRWPVASTLTNMGASLVAPLPKVAKGGGFGTQFLRYAKAGIPLGLAAGSGGSKADLTKGEIGDYFKDVGIGGGTGGLVSGLMGAGSERAFGGLSRYLKDKASENALKAIGAQGGITNAMQKMGFRTGDEAKQLGREALESGLVPFLGSKDAVWRRAVEKVEQLGPAIDDYYQRADAVGAPNFDSAKKVVNDYASKLDPIAKQNAGKLRKFLKAIDDAKASAATFLDTRKMNTSGGKTTRHGVDVPLADDLDRTAKKLFKENIRAQVGELLGDGEREGLEALNKVFSTSKKVEKLASNAATREVSNRGMGLVGSTQGAGMASALGGPEGAATGLLWPKVETALKQRLPAGLAVVQDALSKIQAQKTSPGAARMASYLSSKFATDPDSALAMFQALMGEDEDFKKAAQAAGGEP